MRSIPIFLFVFISLQIHSQDITQINGTKQDIHNHSSLIFDIGVAMGSGIGGSMHLNIIQKKGAIILGYTGLDPMKRSADSKSSNSFTIQYGRLFEGKYNGYTMISIGPALVKTRYFEFSTNGYFPSSYIKSKNTDEDLGIQLDCKFGLSKSSPSVAFDIFLNYNPRRTFGGLSINFVLGKVNS